MASLTKIESIKNLFSTQEILRTLEGNLAAVQRVRAVLLDLTDLTEYSLRTVGDVYEGAFWYLSKYHRYEYVYKALLFKRVILGSHSTRTASMLQEFTLGNSKVDAFVVNGISTSYEVKTEFDNFDRLDRQLADYRRYSDEIYVVTAKSNVNALKSRLPDDIGIKFLDTRGYFSTVRKAQQLTTEYDSSMAVSLLNASELKSISRRLLPEIDSLPNTRVVKRCAEALNSINQSELKQLILSQLRLRGVRKSDFLNQLPFTVSSKISNFNLPAKRQADLIETMKKVI